MLLQAEKKTFLLPRQVLEAVMLSHPGEDFTLTFGKIKYTDLFYYYTF